MSQTSVSLSLTPSVRGQSVDTSSKVDDSFVAEGNLTFGNLVERGTDKDKQAKPIADYSAVAADDDSIVATPIVTAVAEVRTSGAAFDGVIGQARIVPAQLISLTLNNHADWLASECVVVGEGPLGPQREVLVIPVGGNVVLTGKLPFSRVSEVILDAQGGVNGTMDVGTDPAEMLLSQVDFPGVALFDQSREVFSATAEIKDKTSFSVRSRGRIKVQVEAAVEPGDSVFVRTTEVGTDLRGQFRGSLAAGFIQLAGVYFFTTAATDAIATLELGR